MKITILGATGRVGRRITEKAVRDGHFVTVVVRERERAPEGVHTVVEGSVVTPSVIREAISGADLVVSALSTDRTTTLEASISLIIDAMYEYGVTSFISVGTAGILQSETTPHLLRYEAGDSNRKLTFAAEQHRIVFDTLRTSRLQWTIVCPTYMPEGEETGRVIVRQDYMPNEREAQRKVTTGDVAHIVYQLATGQREGKGRLGIAERL